MSSTSMHTLPWYSSPNGWMHGEASSQTARKQCNMQSNNSARVDRRATPKDHDPYPNPGQGFFENRQKKAHISILLVSPTDPISCQNYRVIARNCFGDLMRFECVDYKTQKKLTIFVWQNGKLIRLNQRNLFAFDPIGSFCRAKLIYI